MDVCDPTLLQRLESVAIQIRANMYPLARGAVSDVYPGKYGHVRAAIKISRAPTSEEDRRIIARRCDILEQLEPIAGQIPLLAWFVLDDRLVSCWEEAECTLAQHLQSNRGGKRVTYTRKETLELLHAVADDITTLRENQVRDGEVRPSSILKFSQGLRVGDISRDCFSESQVDGRADQLPRVTPFQGDWRRNHPMARDVYALAVLYSQMRVGDSPFIGVSSRVTNDCLASMDPDETLVVSQTFASNPQPSEMLVEPFAWLSRLAGMRLTSHRKIAERMELRDTHVHWHWLQADNCVVVFIEKSVDTSCRIRLLVPGSKRTEHRLDARRCETTIPLPDGVRSFELVLIASNGQEVSRKRFVDGPRVEAEARELQIRWKPSGWAKMHFYAQHHGANIVAVERKITAEISGVDLVKSAALEQHPCTFYLSPADGDGNRGPATLLTVGPVQRHVGVSYCHTLDTDQNRQFLTVRLDASSCIEAPETEVRWIRSLVDESDPGKTVRDPVNWRGDGTAVVELREIITQDVAEVRFNESQIVYTVKATWGNHRESKLESLAYNYIRKT